MQPHPRIPPLLHLHLSIPSHPSLTLLTSTLGASANWLIVRYILAALHSPNTSNTNPCSSSDSRQHELAVGLDPTGGNDVEGGCNVLLLSLMRDWEFWRTEVRKGGGLDLERGVREGRAAFVDGLEIGLGTGQGLSAGRKSAGPQNGVRGLTTGPVPLPTRGPPSTATTRTPPTNPSQPTGASEKGRFPLPTPTPQALSTAIHAALATLVPSRKTLIILDNPDLLLGLSPTPYPLSSTIPSLVRTLLLHPRVAGIVVHLQADTALLQSPTDAGTGTGGGGLQPLQRAHRNLLVRTAHMSRRIVGTRVLDTGVARDVGGVVRVTGSGERDGWVDLGLEVEEGQDEEEMVGVEYLYQVRGDGSVRVFERGAGGEG